MDLSNNSERLELNDSTQSNPILHSTLNETQANRKNDHKKRTLKSYKRVFLFEEPKLVMVIKIIITLKEIKIVLK